MSFLKRFFGRQSPLTDAQRAKLQLKDAPRDYTAGLTHRSTLDQLAHDRGGRWDRTTEDNGATVVVRLHLPAGDVLVARGPTTDQARLDLVHRLSQRDAALAE